MKRMFVLLSTILLIFSICVFSGDSVHAQISEKPIILKINNYYVAYTAPRAPYIDQNHRFMIPLRTVSELLGGNIQYDSETRVINLTILDNEFTLELESPDAVVNGGTVRMDTTPVMHNNQAFIPMRVLLDAMDVEWNWDQESTLLTLHHDRFMMASDISYAETIDRNQDFIDSREALRPLSIRLEPTQLTITYQNVSGVDLQRGKPDLRVIAAPGRQDEFYRSRPELEKDGIAEFSMSTLENVNINYVVIEGRSLVDEHAELMSKY